MPIKKTSTTTKASTARKAAQRTSKPSRGRKTRSSSSRSRKKHNKLFWPMLAAFSAGILMAVVCFYGIEAGNKPQPATSVAKAPSSRQRVLPPVNDNQASGNNNRSKQAQIEIQKALAEIQEEGSTDQATSFTEKTRHVDYTLLQAASTAGVPAEAVRLESTTPRTANFGDFIFKRYSIVTESGETFAAILARQLDTWNMGAKLFSLGGNTYGIYIDGILTHQLSFVLTASALQHGSNSTGPEHVRKPGQEPKIVIVIDDLGANEKALSRLMQLDFPITCAFWPFASHTRSGAEEAHARGLEIIVHMPMEPVAYPSAKPGPGALFAHMGGEEISQKVRDAISRVPYAVGLNNHMGSRFTQNREKVGYVLDIIKEKNLFMLDSVTHGRTIFYDEAGKRNMQRYQRDVFLDVKATKAAVLGSLKRAEQVALVTGKAIAIGHPLPGTLSALEEWQQTRNKKILIVRLSDL